MLTRAIDRCLTEIAFLRCKLAESQIAKEREALLYKLDIQGERLSELTRSLREFVDVIIEHRSDGHVMWEKGLRQYLDELDEAHTNFFKVGESLVKCSLYPRPPWKEKMDT